MAELRGRAPYAAHTVDDGTALARCGRPGPWTEPHAEDPPCADCAVVRIGSGSILENISGVLSLAVYQVRASEVRAWLSRQPGRCSACAGHLATQGHAQHCPLGLRARFGLGLDGQIIGTKHRGPEDAL